MREKILTAALFSAALLATLEPFGCIGKAASWLGLYRETLYYPLAGFLWALFMLSLVSYRKLASDIRKVKSHSSSKGKGIKHLLGLENAPGSGRRRLELALLAAVLALMLAPVLVFYFLPGFEGLMMPWDECYRTYSEDNTSRCFTEEEMNAYIEENNQRYYEYLIENYFEEADMLDDPSFENGTWRNVSDCCNGEPGLASINVENSRDSIDGQYSLKLKSQNHCACVSQILKNFQNNSIYLISFYYKGDNPRICLWVRNNNKCMPSNTFNSASAWKFTYYIQNFSESSFNANLHLYSNSYNEGLKENYYDDFKIYELKEDYLEWFKLFKIDNLFYQFKNDSNNYYHLLNQNISNTKLECLSQMLVNEKDILLTQKEIESYTSYKIQQLNELGDKYKNKENLLEDPSFENGTWNKEVSNCCTYTESLPNLGMEQNLMSREGKYSLKLWSNNQCACVSQSILNFSKDVIYLFSFDYKGNAPRYCIWTKNDNKCLPSKNLPPSNEWKNEVNLLEFTDKSVTATVFFYSNSYDGEKTETYYDDVRLFSISEEDYREYLMKINKYNSNLIITKASQICNEFISKHEMNLLSPS